MSYSVANSKFCLTNHKHIQYNNNIVKKLKLAVKKIYQIEYSLILIKFYKIDCVTARVLKTSIESIQLL